ncbi:MFS transporter [Pueribacillus theae]|uniref:MFS transporter n=1 Tax=Pueribacillus theae TaxID=2171751 RepID=A0A2U1K4X2_9BACI|nr:MFS transporter [Pueribacillus theae]PWA12244.1 MFS transporter [Pueribacillus theae]
MPKITRGTPAFWRTGSALFLGGFVVLILLYTTQPLFPIFSEEFGVSPATASLTISLTTGSLAIFMLITAGLSESWGKKKLMTLSLFLSSALTIIIAFSPNFTVLLLLRLLLGITIAGLPAIAMAYVNEEFHPKSIGFVMGLYVSGNTLGGMTGRILTGVVTDYSSWRIAFFIVGFLCLLCSVWFWRVLPPSRKKESVDKPRFSEIFRPLVPHLKNQGLLCLYGLAFLLMGSIVTLYNYVTYLLLAPPYDLSHTLVSWIFIVYLTGTFSSAWMGKLSDRLGRVCVVGMGIAFMLIGVVITLHGSVFIKVVGIALLTFGFFGCHSVASSWVGVWAKEHKAHASSLYLLFYYGGSSIVGFVGGLFWSSFHWMGVVSYISALLVAGFVLVVRLNGLSRYGKGSGEA